MSFFNRHPDLNRPVMPEVDRVVNEFSCGIGERLEVGHR